MNWRLILTGCAMLVVAVLLKLWRSYRSIAEMRRGHCYIPARMHPAEMALAMVVLGGYYAPPFSPPKRPTSLGGRYKTVHPRRKIEDL